MDGGMLLAISAGQLARGAPRSRHPGAGTRNTASGDATMAKAARMSYAELTSLMGQMPDYNTYCSCGEAAHAERNFRHALGQMLKECGERLLGVSEMRPQLLSAEQQEMIDDLIERIGSIMRRLDREGVICLVGDCPTTINELEEIDTRIVLLVEEALTLVRNLTSDVPATSWFKNEAGMLSRDLADFSEAAEERNYLLGLGWESEFCWNGRGN
jgi:hypothetical protein